MNVRRIKAIQDSKGDESYTSIYGKIIGDIRMRSPLVANTDHGGWNLRIISQFDTYWRTYVEIQI